jgi:hypothetical protein
MFNFFKGKKLEDEIEYVYQHILSNESVDIKTIKKRCKIRDKNGVEREFDVYYEFDVAGRTHKVAIECKNYRRAIEVGIVDAFIGKLHDFPNMMGAIVSPNGYQVGAIRKAQSHGIELLDYDSLPKFNDIVVNRLERACLPTIIGNCETSSQS